MLRYRRYRAFLLLTAVTIFLLYWLSASSQWSTSSINSSAIKDRFHQLSGHHRDKPLEVWKPKEEVKPKKPQAQPDSPPDPAPPKIPSKEEPKKKPPAADDIPKPVQKIPPGKVGDSTAKDAQNGDDLIPGPISSDRGQWSEDSGLEKPLFAGEHWKKRPEHYPVPKQSIIQLPVGKGKAIPKIQHDFAKDEESDPFASSYRLQYKSSVKAAFLHAWEGYKSKAWGMDELKPVTGKSKNTFNGWSATLVDAMDTMWIMGLTKEFEAAVEFVRKIDFYTSTRNEIPVFETTIRYLGGLLGAYDVSNGKYPVLLDQAKVLGDLLMAAFDTPNRMPVTYYSWRPLWSGSAQQSSHAVLAEIGSLQMEFTRLAQLTGNSSYYDAITRVVDALEDMQMNTTLKGLWPADVDTSGCMKSSDFYQAPNRKLENTFTYLDDVQKKEEMVPLEKPEPLTFSSKPPKAKEVETSSEPVEKPKSASDPELANDDDERPAGFKKRTLQRRAYHPPKDVPPNSIPDWSKAFPNRHGMAQTQSGPTSDTECMTVGITAAAGLEKYTLGSTADSAFEYLTKQYLLLQGQVDKYRTMYEKAIDVANKVLISRVMIPDEKRELYIAGEAHVTAWGGKHTVTYEPSQTHLVCFVGGMYAMGAKVFNRPADLDIAAKLTDACVWAYESTATGIMPEQFQVVGCQSRSKCAWNETHWNYAIDPDADSRWSLYEDQMKSYSSQLKEWQATHKPTVPQATEAAKASRIAKEQKPKHANKVEGGPRAEVTADQAGAREPPANFDPHAKHEPPKLPDHAPKRDTSKDKRQIHQMMAEQRQPKQLDLNGGVSPSNGVESSFRAPTTPHIIEDDRPPIWKPPKPDTHAEYVKSQKERYGLKEGMLGINDPRYLLR